MGRSLLVVLLSLGMLEPQHVRVLTRIGSPGGGGGGGDNTAPLLTGSDITYLGACFPPATGGYNVDSGTASLTLHNIGGTDYLYSYDFNGNVQEYTMCADANLKTSPPFNSATQTTAFGDIYQSALCRHAGGPSAPTDVCGLANGVRPSGLGWTNTDTKLYYLQYLGYETSGADYDLGIGRSTLNRGGGTGTGEKMWALAYRPYHDTPADPINDALVNVGNRWVNGVVDIPSWFQTYTGGFPLAVGWGGPSISTESVGPIAYGMALFAFDPTVLGATANLGIMGGSAMKKLAYIPSGLAGNVRTSHGGVTAYQVHDWAHEDVLIDSSTDKVVWSDYEGNGSWVDGTVRQGIVIPWKISAGTLDTTISSASAYNVFTVASIGDAVVGDRITFQTDWAACNATDYPEVWGPITNISGTTITIDTSLILCADNSTGLMPSTNRPLVGGWAHQGTQYLGGGSHSTRTYLGLYIYNPQDFKHVAQGISSPSSVQPTSIYQMPLAALTQPFDEQAFDRFGATLASAYSPVTHRLYIYATRLWQAVPNDHNPKSLVHVFQLPG